jgi:NADPH-dependent 2,4-dienoyl-CoA reductase/sulfur reductase-like enzyme
MTRPSDNAQVADRMALRDKYKAERDKRLVPGRAAVLDLTDSRYSAYLDDPYTPRIARESMASDVDVVIVGGGFSGLLVGARLKEAGLKDIRIVEKAGVAIPVL